MIKYFYHLVCGPKLLQKLTSLVVLSETIKTKWRKKNKYGEFHLHFFLCRDSALNWFVLNYDLIALVVRGNGYYVIYKFRAELWLMIP